MKTWLKISLPVAVIVIGITGAAVINATGTPPIEPVNEASPGPVVTVRSVNPESHQFSVTSWGELQPREKTTLTPEVTGRVIAFHENFIEGGLIRKDEVLVRLDDSDYRTALLSAESNLAAAQAQLQEEQALARVAQEEWRNTQDPTPLALRLPQLQSSEAAVKSAEAGLQKAQRDLDRTQIRAPYDALVRSRNTGVGQVVSMGTTLGEIYNVERAEIHLPIASFDLQFLQEQVVGSQAYIDTLTDPRPVSIVRDLGIIDTQTRMTRLVASLDDPYGLHSDKPTLRFGQFVAVHIEGQSINQVYRLPQEALVRDSIWLVSDDNTLQRQQVDILRKEGRDVLITEGISSTDTLVVMPPNFPQHGMKVRPVAEDTLTAQE
ncbi:efflux RND transporter periplasmic adaptor subunit [Aliidiomarina sedimenti]|uniref:Efflux RND transporter periplasmic adaptor subunit n=1 Tax=Aliidiomarina sedimenti TaxID=1933879 RepID=A0ABY0C0R7_9GAMM|nr:efflux RND transporter periplasmic adaptor subunit [Aliidiomarina sedimenti]RUO30809.1 efflux RND transporter periplasmic adaptor subunit [Aliidiomarina sedimenti]